LDEEGVEGQDETTIRPQPEQGSITVDTAFTAGTVTQADGTVRDPILSVMDGQIVAVDVVPLTDASVFPLRVRSVLPPKGPRSPLDILVGP